MLITVVTIMLHLALNIITHIRKLLQDYKKVESGMEPTYVQMKYTDMKVTYIENTIQQTAHKESQ